MHHGDNRNPLVRYKPIDDAIVAFSDLSNVRITDLHYWMPYAWMFFKDQ